MYPYTDVIQFDDPNQHITGNFTVISAIFFLSAEEFFISRERVRENASTKCGLTFVAHKEGFPQLGGYNGES